MVRYGIYTVKELERFAKGLTPKRNITILSECTKCDFVYDGQMCLNCHPWNTVRWRATCPRDQSSSAIIICVQRGSLLDVSIESVLKRGINPINLQNGYIENMGIWSLNAKTVHGDAISLPCVLCRKAMERLDICWEAHDGVQWVHSKKSEYVPPSIPTAKQKRNLGFGCND